MKKTKLKELKDKSAEALQIELEQTQKQLFAMRSQAVTEKLANPLLPTQTRRHVARLKTLLRQKQTAEQSGEQLGQQLGEQRGKQPVEAATPVSN
jgi:ribosomal protein L29